MTEKASCERFIQGIVSHPPTIIGKLVYVAGLRNKATGRYSHPGAESACTDEFTDRALRNQHQKLFHMWLALTLERQVDELETFLAGVANDGQDASDVIAGLPDLAPAGAFRHEIELFRSDLEIVLLMAQPAPKEQQVWEPPDSWKKWLPGFLRATASVGQFKTTAKI